MKVGSLLALVVALALIATYYAVPPIEFDVSRPSESVLLPSVSPPDPEVYERGSVYTPDKTVLVEWTKPDGWSPATRYHLELTGFPPESGHAPVTLDEQLHVGGSRQMRYWNLRPGSLYRVCISTGIPLFRPFGAPECLWFVTDERHPD